MRVACTFGQISVYAFLRTSELPPLASHFSRMGSEEGDGTEVHQGKLEEFLFDALPMPWGLFVALKDYVNTKRNLLHCIDL